MRRPFLLFFFILLLIVPSLQAGEPGPARQPAHSAWDLLTRAWGFLMAVWNENGCEFDPSGRCGS